MHIWLILALQVIISGPLGQVMLIWLILALQVIISGPFGADNAYLAGPYTV